MKDTIRFKGLTLNRDEYSTENGEMALCGGVEVHDGALRASVLQGSQVNSGVELPFKLLYVHKTDDYEMFITLDEDSGYLCAYKAGLDIQQHPIWEGAGTTGGDNGVITTAVSFKYYKSIASVGNTLIVMNDGGSGNEGLHYFFCRNTSQGWKYEYIGKKPPFIPLQFSLEPHFDYLHDRYEWDLPADTPYYDPELNDNETLNPEIRSLVTEHVIGKINERIDKISGEGYFYAPFLIRYCYRMYDGSMIMHSAPVLMMPMLHHPVMTFVRTLTQGYTPGVDPGVDGDIYNIFVQRCKLMVRCLNAQIVNANNLGKWKDLIKSVDIFITPQFSRIDTSQMIEKVGINFTDFNYALFSGVEYINNPSISGMFQTTYDYDNIYSGNLISYILPEYSESDYFSRIRRASYFYKLATINIDDIQSKIIDAVSAEHQGFAELEFDASILHNIAVQEQMRDDYKTHNDLIPVYDKEGGLYVYNGRLNVFGLSEKLFEGFSPQIMFPYVITSGASDVTARTYITTDSGTFRVNTDSVGGSWSDWLLKNGYIFYPDARAVAMHFYGGGSKRRLTASDELNASLSFMDDSQIDSLPSPVNVRSGIVSPAIVPILNKVYTSKADNPYNFNMYPGEAAINTMGNGEVMGLAVCTRGLSGETVGNHDLVALCTDGLWALKVSASGTYSDLHIFSREISINQKIICQLDQSFLFATNRSINRVVERDVTPITEVLDGPYFDIKDKLEAFADAYCWDGEGEEPENYDADADALIQFAVPPTEYYYKGRMLYDYQGNRLIILPEDTEDGSVALVFSIRDRAWSTMVLPPLKSVVNFYPTPYVQLTSIDPYSDSGTVLKLNTPYDYSDQTLHTGVVVTRTMAWSDTMDVLRGFRQYTDAENMPMLYFFGSNDQRTWNYIGNSERSFHNYIPGHPYRFFRVAMYLRLHTSEKYQALALEIINKYAKL